MTALERALVVYAEAKGYGIEVEYRLGFWKNKQYEGKFDFGQCEYRIKNREDYRKVYDELSDFFKPLYTPDKTSKLLSDMERAKYKPAGFSCKTKMYTREEIEEMNKAKEEIHEAHKFTLDMKFKVGDKVKIKPSFKDDGVYTIYGFECSVNANNQCHLIMYQLLTSEGEFGKWTREDALELYNPKQPEAVPATEEELKEMELKWYKSKNGSLFCSTKESSCIPYPDEVDSDTFRIFDPVSKTWQDWSEK